ncbi:MAG: AAA family ATPase [Nanoarchaeota archaeon]
MGKVIGIFSLKGGVGKTTIASSLACDLAYRHGMKVLLIDANYTAPNVLHHMNVTDMDVSVHDALRGEKLSSAIYSRYGVDVVPGNFLYRREVNPLKLKDKLAYFRKNYDFIILDSAPALNNDFFSAFFASDELFLVTTPDYPTLSCSIKLAKFAEQKGKSIRGIILNRIAEPSFEVNLHEIQESTGVPVVSQLKEDKSVKEALFVRAPVTLLSPNSKFSKELGKLSDSLAGVPEKTSLWKRFLYKDKASEEVNREVLKEHFYTSIFKE